MVRKTKSKKIKTISKKKASKKKRLNPRASTKKTMGKNAKKYAKKTTTRTVKKATKKAKLKTTRKTTKRAAKKTTKRAAKKTSKRTSRKIVKKTAKKAKSKTTRKSTKRAAKKTSKRTSRKTVKKTTKIEKSKTKKKTNKKAGKRTQISKQGSFHPILLKIRDQLIHKQKEIYKILQISREVERNPSELNFSNEIDLAASLEGREMAFTLSSRDRNELRLIEETLFKISNGSYGTCESCSKKIGMKRLAIMPLTPYCIECQSTKEHP